MIDSVAIALCAAMIVLIIGFLLCSIIYYICLLKKGNIVPDESCVLWQAGLSKLCDAIEQEFPKGTIIDFMGVDYCVVGFHGEKAVYQIPQAGVMCLYTDKDGNPRYHFFNAGVFCVIRNCIKYKPDVELIHD